ncbi:hypothetical protein [Roseibium sp. MMSF_3412]|uniref:hypothetical protein n=1 Tax=Roseibium sp. MMSF_3412 TaxID=3046712 RepID=UPI00273F76E9|nr:hypothetical protein [Roseibium sp. MMSF_3412]
MTYAKGIYAYWVMCFGLAVLKAFGVVNISFWWLILLGAAPLLSYVVFALAAVTLVAFALGQKSRSGTLRRPRERP